VEEDINLLQLQYDALDHELSAKKIDADRASRKLREAMENLVPFVMQLKMLLHS
jgi:hypothetical protein